MSKSWVCAICGTSIISKCPEQRSIFPSFKESLIDSILSIQRVDDLRGNSCELFLNYTSSQKHTTGQAIKAMIELISDPPKYLDNLGCEHVWVLNSMDETTCSMGCTHHNLNDIERLKMERTTEAVPAQTQKKLLREYASVLSSVVEQARKAINVSKPAYDVSVENDFYHIKRTIGTMFHKMGTGEHVQEPYRVRVARSPCLDPSSYVYFNSLIEAQRYVTGTRLTMLETVVEVEELDESQECYRTIADYPRVEYACCICGKPADDLFIITPEGYAAHQKCYAKKLDMPKKRLRSTTIQLQKDAGYDITDTLLRIFELKTCQYSHRRNAQFGYLRISAVCTGAELDDLVSGITYYLN